MKRTLMRLLSIMVCLAILLSTVPMSAFADVATEKTDVSGTIYWVSRDRQSSGSRPTSVQLTLYANDVETEYEAVLTLPSTGYGSDPNAAWTYKFVNVPKYDEEGKLITYTVKQGALTGYETTRDSSTLNITNSYIGGMSTTDTINHLDVRINGAALEVHFVTKDALGNVVDARYENITAFVTAVKSFNLNNVQVPSGGSMWNPTWTTQSLVFDGDEFEDLGTHEFRKLNMNFRLTNETTAVFVVDLKDEHGDVFENVQVSCGLGAIMAAAYECDGYFNNNIDGLDFIVGSVSNFKVEVISIGLEIDIEKQIQLGDANPVPYEGDGSDFSFLIKEYEVAEDGTKTPTNKADPKIEYKDGKWVGLVYYSYSSIHDLENYKGKTFAYEVSEIKGDNGIYTYDETVYEFTVKFDLQKIGHDNDGGFDEVLAPVIQEEEYKDHRFVFTNKIKTVDVSGTKVWVDGDDQDGIRPDSITVYLIANGEQMLSQTVTADNGWKWSFTGLSQFDAEGKEIDYTVSEEPVDGYTTNIENGTITNTHTPEVITISGSKTWVDDNNRDGKRPSSITINLLANGEVVNSATVDEASGWAWSFTAPKYQKGVLVNYTVREAAVEGYTPSYNGYNVTNTHEIETTKIAVEKVWQDNDNQDGIRPEKITVQLLANGQNCGQAVELTADGNWTYTWENLPVNEAGVAIVYTVVEAEVPGYEGEYTVNNGTLVITNTHAPETTVVSGFKTWVDDNNRDGIRPSTIIINLLADGEQVATKEVTVEDGWAWSFTNLPKYDNGVVIEYTITEGKVEGYTTEINGFNVTNTHAPEKLEVFGEKVWVDANDQDGKRPSSITINLLANGSKIASQTVSAENGWKWTFADLFKYENGEEIVYTIEEVKVADYETKISGSVETGFVVTNTHTPETVVVSGEKIWNDNKNQDGKRPESITINLLADDKVVATKTVNAEANWAWSFTNLPKFKAGKEIKYTITEEAVEGYTTEVNGFNVTNTHEIEKITVSGGKTWNDNNNQDGKRPESITINLFANGEKIDSKVVTAADGWKWTFENVDKYANGTEIVYTIAEDAVENYTTTYDGYNVINSYTPEVVSVSGSKNWQDNQDQDGKRPESITINLFANGEKIDSKVVTAADGWKWNFTGLDKFKAGVEIEYTITEEAVEGYTTEVDGFNVTNTHEIEKITISGGKTWVDNNDQDGKRPESITINLFANGEKIDSKVVTAADGWKWSFTGLDKFKAGVEVEYTITEDAVDGYESKVEGFDVTNTHEIEKITISGGKTWEDNNNQDGKRPESITINLLANGVKVDSIVVTAEDEWTWIFEDLDKYVEGEEIVYTITEDAVDGYESKVEGFDVTNTHEIEKITISGGKTWEDNNDQDGKRPESITINLLANGVKVDSIVVTAEAEWKWSFENVDKYANGEEIVYTITEEAVEGYEAKVDGFNVTNTHEVSKITIEVSKVWKDDNDKAGLRADSVTVILLADGKETEYKLVLDAAGQWKGAFEDLDEFADGKKIVYTVKEVAVENYATEITGDAAEGFVVTNTLNVIPPTSDSSLIGAFALVLVLSFALLAVLILNKKRLFA